MSGGAAARTPGRLAWSIAVNINDKVLPFYEQHELPVLRILETEYCEAPRHDYQLFLAIRHRPHQDQSQIAPDQGVCERFHKTILQEFYQVTFFETSSNCRMIWTNGSITTTMVSVRSGRGMGAVKRISHVEARPHKVLSFCW